MPTVETTFVVPSHLGWTSTRRVRGESSTKCPIKLHYCGSFLLIIYIAVAINPRKSRYFLEIVLHLLIFYDAQEIIISY